MPAFTAWAPTVGRALSEGAQGFTEVMDPESERNLKRDESKLRLAEAAQRLLKGNQPTIQALGYGNYAVTYPDGRIEMKSLGPQPTKDAPAVARLKHIQELLQSDDPAKQELGRTELEKDKAPARNAETNQTRLKQTYDMHRERLKAHMAEVEKRIATARALGDQRALVAAQQEKAAMARVEAQFGWKREEFALEQEAEQPEQDLKAQKLQEQLTALRAKNDPNNPRQQLEMKRLEAQIANVKNQTLERINKGERDEETHQLNAQTGEEKLKQLRQKGGANLDAKLKGELERLEQQVTALKARGEALGPYLTARLQKLEDSIEQAQGREQRAEDKAGREAQLAPLKEQDIRGRIKGRDTSKNRITIHDGMTDRQLIGKDADLFELYLSRFSGDAKKDATVVQGLPRQHDRLIGRLAYFHKYQKNLPAETSAMPKDEPDTPTAKTPQPDALSANEQTKLLREIGMPEQDSTGEKLIEEFLVRLKKMPVEEATERYKKLTDPEQQRAFKIAFLDVYKRRPPE